MCGIVGIYSFANRNIVDREILSKMCDVLKHRGPDDEGYYISDLQLSNLQVGLGMRRLSVIDLTTGHQPIHNEDKSIWIVCNGEIYNFLELREELLAKGHKFYTKSDVEVVVHLYEEYGTDCLRYLNGMFAFALWDEKRYQLFLVRDRVGKKPLYYTFNNGSLIFASEIKAILVYLNKMPQINYTAIDNFLTYQYIPQPMTIYENIFSLLPAEYMVCDKNGNYKIEKYWRLDFNRKEEISFDDACHRIRCILEDATKKRLISDVPLGAFLSGGVDSSIVVGLMAKNSSSVKTFSVGFMDSEEKEDSVSELKYAKIVSQHFGTVHTEIMVEPKMVEILPKLIWFYDQPFADTSMIPSFYVSKVTRKYVTVALNGDGGDENFCGYLRYKAIKASDFLPFEILGKSFYEVSSKILSSFLPLEKRKQFKRFSSVLGHKTAMRNILWHIYFSNEQKKDIYSKFMKEQIKSNCYEYMLNVYYNSSATDVIDKISYTDINTYLPSDLLVKMDIASMSNSLEARSPFLDYRLLEFTSSIPSKWKIHNFSNKYILKKAFESFLPKEIISRKKQGFGVPVGRWLRNELKEYVKEILLSEKFFSRGYFERKGIEKILLEHFEQKEDHGYRIFALLVLELWHHVFVDKSLVVR